MVKMRKNISRLLSYLLISWSFNPSISIASQLAASTPKVDACESTFKKPVVEIESLSDFGKAMTEGLILREDQVDLFELYRSAFFGDPQTDVEKRNLTNVTSELARYPGLTKKIFVEYNIDTTTKIFPVTEDLKELVRGKRKVASTIKSNFFKPTSNLEFWKKLLSYSPKYVPQTAQAKLTKEQERAQRFEDNLIFTRYLELIIGQRNRHYLEDTENDFSAKTQILFQTLYRLLPLLEKRKLNTHLLRQSLVDLIAMVGYQNPATVELLQSRDGLAVIEGLKKAQDEADSLAINLNYKNLSDLMKSLRIEFITGLSRGEVVETQLKLFEEQVLIGEPFKKPNEKIRVRSLSIQESPFRSCLGGTDCSSRTYFSKALDPNFIYFTMTDINNKSSGHITVVLGEAKDVHGKKVKVAFADKLQNVSNALIINFLSAVSMSLSEEGYVLGISQDLTSNSGLSNYPTTNAYIKSLLPLLGVKYQDYTPHQHRYRFLDQYSRAYRRPSVAIWDIQPDTSQTQILRGQTYSRVFSSKNLNLITLFQDVLALKNSSIESDLVRYIGSRKAIAGLIAAGAKIEFEADLVEIYKNKQNSFKVRKLAFYDSILNTGIPHAQPPDLFSETEWQNINGEIQQWSKSNSETKRTFLANLIESLSKNTESSPMQLRLAKQAISLSIEVVNKLWCQSLQNGDFSSALYLAQTFANLINHDQKELKFCKEPAHITAYRHAQNNVDGQRLFEHLLENKDLDLSLVDSSNNDLFYYAARGNDRKLIKQIVGKLTAPTGNQTRSHFLAGLGFIFRNGDIDNFLLYEIALGGFSAEELRKLIDENTDFSRNENIRLTAILLKRPDFDPNFKVSHPQQSTLISSAIRHLASAKKAGDIEGTFLLNRLLNSLVKHPLSDLNQQDRNGKRALDYAIATKDKKIIALIKSSSPADGNKPKSLIEKIIFWK